MLAGQKPARSTSTRSGPSYFRRPESQSGAFGFVLIVRAASKLEILNRAGTAGRKWHDVMELDEGSLPASARLTRECTAALIA